MQKTYHKKAHSTKFKQTNDKLGQFTTTYCNIFRQIKKCTHTKMNNIKFKQGKTEEKLVNFHTEVLQTLTFKNFFKAL